ncbi:hypothetical protein KBI23_01185 [bacterium]|nr:hypothetical protein [bacterium]MBP9808880.1 hypothetical protein [bacterium]
MSDGAGGAAEGASGSTRDQGNYGAADASPGDIGALTAPPMESGDTAGAVGAPPSARDAASAGLSGGKMD